MDSVSHNTSAAPVGVVGGEEETSYRTVSVLAIFSLLLGLAAPLCFAAPLLLAIPFFGIALAGVAIARIAGSDGLMVGRMAAVVGLALCIASLAAAMTRSVVRDELLSQQAREVGLEWLTRLQSRDAEAAFKMTQESMRRASPPEPGEPERPKDEPFKLFSSNSLVAYLLEHGEHSTIRFDHDLGSGDGPLRQFRLEQQYTVSDEGHAEKPIVVVVTLQRSLLDGQLRWIVANYGSDDIPSTTDVHSHDHSHSH